MRKPINNSRAGLTLIELLIAMSLLGIVLSSVDAVLNALASGYRSGATRQELDAMGARVVQKVVSGLRFADPEAVLGLAEAPFYGTSIEYRPSSRYDEVSTSWGDLQRLQYSTVDDTLLWVRETSTGETGVVLKCEGVAEYQAGEIANGIDDNGNGLVDEPGFCVAQDGDLVTVWLTLKDTDHARKDVERSWSASIRCRN